MTSNRGRNAWRRLLSMLMIPWVDRIIAVAAAAPFAHVMYSILKRGEMTIPLARAYSQKALAITIVWCSLFAVKSFVEEYFLRETPEYADYLARVRWRWFPGVA